MNRKNYYCNIIISLVLVIFITTIQPLNVEAAKKTFKYNVYSKNYDLGDIYKLSGGKWKKKGGKYYYYKKGKKQYKKGKYAYYSLNKGGKKYEYLLDKNGARVTGWTGISTPSRPDTKHNLKVTILTGKEATHALASGKVGTLEYFDQNGVKVKNGIKEINGEKYIFFKDGSLVTQYLQDDDEYYIKNKKIYYADKMGRFLTTCDYWIEPKTIVYDGVKMQRVYLDQQFMTDCVNAIGGTSRLAETLYLTRTPQLMAFYTERGITEKTWTAFPCKELIEMSDDVCKKVAAVYAKTGELQHLPYDANTTKEYISKYETPFFGQILAASSKGVPDHPIGMWVSSTKGHFEILCSADYVGFACYYLPETGDYITLGTCGSKWR